MKRILKLSLTLIFLLFTIFGLWVFRLDQTIKNKIDGNRFLPPTEFYSSSTKLTQKQTVFLHQIDDTFHQAQFRKRPPNSSLFPGDYSLWSPTQCQKNTYLKIPPETKHCLAFRDFNTSSQQIQLLVLEENHTQEHSKKKNEQKIASIYQGPPFKEIKQTLLPPLLFAQYIGNSPTQRKIVSLGSIPTHCKNALLAIEDSQFLEHSGISPLAILRAFWNLIKKQKITQGGSTITQQLVKVYFLNSERTFKRKIIEAVMALILEHRISKDDILELYTNSIYMGQQGVFQIRGFAAASEYYFNKPINKINLPQCALLAATLNSPGLFNPFTQPENSRNRRNHVLKRMAQFKMISSQQKDSAQKASLPQKPSSNLKDNASYYINAVRQKLKKLNISMKDGGRIYTSLDLNAQKTARQAINRQLNRLEKNRPQLKKSGHSLQASLISVDTATGHINALVGGRNYKKSHFNRVLESKRQIGSLMKPFVYLTALESLDENGNPITPLYQINDSIFTHSYEGQKWTPHNYNKKYLGPIPLYFALKNSLNVPTAKIGLQIGLEAIIDTAKRLKISSSLKPVPSLTLGAFEVSTWELARAYTAIARMGNLIDISLIQKIESLKGDTLYLNSPSIEQVVSPSVAAVLIGILKETLRTGTARSIGKWYGFNRIAAGKTGTTSDHRDAWFSGFTPRNLTIVWVGFDDNRSHKLTGASGAIPIWADYMRNTTLQYQDEDFNWPESVTPHFYSRENLQRWPLPELQWPDFQGIELIIKK